MPPALSIDYGNNAGEPFRFIVVNVSDSPVLDVKVEVQRSDGEIIPRGVDRLNPGDVILCEAGEMSPSPSPTEVGEAFTAVTVTYLVGEDERRELKLKWRKSTAKDFPGDMPATVRPSHVPVRSEHLQRVG